MQEFQINLNDAGQRLDKYLTKAFPALPKSLLYKFIRIKKIKVNRKRAQPEQVLREGDVVTFFIPHEFTEKQPSDHAFKWITPHLNVVYEDADMLLCDKPCGVCCIPDANNAENTLIDQIKAYLYQKGEYDPDAENSFAPALCNRIDRNTGGIVIAAKNAASLREINSLIKARKVTKKYLCVVHGTPSPREATLKAYMIKDPENNKVAVYNNMPDSSDARTMITAYRVLSDNNGLSLLEVELLTGRTHQIRAHLSSIGHPLLGDGKYGVNKEDRKLGYKYQALYSYYLKIKDVECRIEPESIWFVKELFPNTNLK